MKSPHIVLIDNFDSFTYNIVDYFKQCGARVTVYRNTVSVQTIVKSQPDLIVYSPGPGNPSQAGNLLSYIGYFSGGGQRHGNRAKRIPQFGVCLGLQAIVEVFGGSLQVLKKPVHGKSSAIHHDGKTIFAQLPNPMLVGRYHSLAAKIMPPELEISATTVGDNIVMALRHKTLPIEAVQFHPESILTSQGKTGLQLIKNILRAL